MYHTSRMGGGSRIYNVKQHILHEDGLLTIKATGYEGDGTHWTGWMTLEPSNPDYGFWYWMACVQRVSELVQERELSQWKASYRMQTDWAKSETVWLDPLSKQPRKKAPVE